MAMVFLFLRKKTKKPKSVQSDSLPKKKKIKQNDLPLSFFKKKCFSSNKTIFLIHVGETEMSLSTLHIAIRQLNLVFNFYLQN